MDLPGAPGSAMPCHALPCSALPCCALPCHALSYSAILYVMLWFTIPCHTLLCFTIPCHTFPYSSTILYYAKLCHALWRLSTTSEFLLQLTSKSYCIATRRWCLFLKIGCKLPHRSSSCCALDGHAFQSIQSTCSLISIMAGLPMILTLLELWKIPIFQKNTYISEKYEFYNT